jgi:hypothetical protein
MCPPFKPPLGRNIPLIESRQKRALIPRSPFLEEAIMFDVDNNLDDECPIRSLRQGGIASRTPSPSFSRGGL